MRYDWSVSVDGQDVGPLCKAGGTIDYGRPTVFTGYSAPTAEFTLFTEVTYPNYAGTWPTIELNDPVIIHVTWDGVTQWRRFTGVVQALDWSPSGLRVTCTGTGTDWQNKYAGYTNQYFGVGDQTENDRVDYLCGAAGVTIDIEGAPARRIRSIPVNSLDAPLLDQLLRVADDCDALLVEDRLGVVHYRTRNFARPATYTLPADIVERDSLDMNLERGLLVNAVTVYYGEVDPDTGQQRSVYDTDVLGDGTILSYGPIRADIATDLKYQASAEGKLASYLEKHRIAWHMPDVVLIMSEATGAQADDIFDLQENWHVEVTPLPDGCPIPAYEGDILGFTDIMLEDDYRIVLHLGPYVADTGLAPEVPIFPADSLEGGTTSTYEDDYGYLWQLHKWESVGSYVATCNNDVNVDVLVVGGGGGGGSATFFQGGGGGGAGAVFAYPDLPLTAGSIDVKVGAGGALANWATFEEGKPGGDSRFAGAIVYGGGGGGAGANADITGSAGGPGGFGGGGGGLYGAGGAGTYGSLDSGATTNTTEILGGNGVQSPLTGGSTVIRVGGAGGGASLTSTITDTSVVYAQAGQPSRGTNGNTPGSGGAGGARNSINVDGLAGYAGIVVARYRIG